MGLVRGGRSAAADLGDQEDLAGGGEGCEEGVLVDLAVDGDGHLPLDVLAEPGVAAVELTDRLAHRAGVDLELGDITGEVTARGIGGDDARHGARPPLRHAALRRATSPTRGEEDVDLLPPRGGGGRPQAGRRGRSTRRRAVLTPRRWRRGSSEGRGGGRRGACRWRRGPRWPPPPGAARSAPRRRPWPRRDGAGWPPPPAPRRSSAGPRPPAPGSRGSRDSPSARSGRRCIPRSAPSRRPGRRPPAPGPRRRTGGSPCRRPAPPYSAAP